MYTLKNPESDFKKGLVKESEDKKRFSIYIGNSSLEQLEELVDEEGFSSRNQAIVEAINDFIESKGISK